MDRSKDQYYGNENARGAELAPPGIFCSIIKFFSIKINKNSKTELYEIHKAYCGQNDDETCYFCVAMIKSKYMRWCNCSVPSQLRNTIDFRGAEALERGVKHGTVFEQ